MGINVPYQLETKAVNHVRRAKPQQGMVSHSEGHVSRNQVRRYPGRIPGLSLTLHVFDDSI